jgi:four helix bundle protein
MDKIMLQKRTKQFALRIFAACESLPRTITGKTIASQLARSASSVGANYRAACLGRSKAEFYSKLSITLEEADESAYWLELAIEAKLIAAERLQLLFKEANELTAIFMASRKTASRK